MKNQAINPNFRLDYDFIFAILTSALFEIMMEFRGKFRHAFTNKSTQPLNSLSNAFYVI